MQTSAALPGQREIAMNRLGLLTFAIAVPTLLGMALVAAVAAPVARDCDKCYGACDEVRRSTSVSAS
jgi:hypothetical protein